ILSILTICVSIYSIGYISSYYGKRKVGLFYFLYTTFILSMIFVFTSSNAIFFYMAWEAMALLSYFLVIFESERPENTQAGTLYIVMTHIATAFLLIGFMICYSYTQSFNIFGDTSNIPGGMKSLVFILFLLGFGTKAGVIPLHIWLPYAHPAAPSNISALMSGIMIKTAIYGLIRFVPGFLGVEYTWWGILVLCLGVFSAVMGIAYAFMENDIKRLLAYSSVENIGIIFIGLGVGFIALANGSMFVGSLALVASVLHTLNHAFFKGGLFLSAGSIHFSTGTKNIENLGGLIKSMPITALLTLSFSIAIASIVPFNGFIGEWLTLQSIFSYIGSGQSGINIILILSVAGLGLAGALAAACFVKLFGVSFLGLQRSEHATKAKKVPTTMNVGMSILAMLCLVIGLFPLYVITLIDKAISGVVGISIMDKMNGGFVVSWYSMEFAGNSISAVGVLLGAGALVLLTLLVIRIFGGKYIERKYGTWDCGFEALNSRMQYTSTGFSKPIKIIFRILFRPSRRTIIKGGTSYHPERVEYTVDSESIFERYIYEPVFVRARILSRRTKFIVQTGNIQSYLIYIFVTVLVLMAYNRFI
ncbi:MAG TPA: proton-conducting transporter membrane subunit, partial [Anaerovoracaceae bacterium]|nr:proton-conducting transporter membrane subunit [Anaerovoracaceae bacterium]